MSEYTKGKWIVTDEDVRGDDIFYRVEAEGYGLIALVDATPESDELKANANLIATAPETKEQRDDLLEVCENSKEWFKKLKPLFEDCSNSKAAIEMVKILDDIDKILEAAIKKASPNSEKGR